MSRFPNLYQIADDALGLNSNGGVEQQPFQLVVSAAMQEIRASERKRVAQNRRARLSGCAFRDQRPDQRIHLRAMVYAKDVLSGYPVGRNEPSDDTHPDFIAAVEEGVARGFGSILPEDWQREHQQQEQVPHAVAFLLRE